MGSAQFTQRRKSLFLRNYAETGNISLAARAAGIERRSIYVWQERDGRFAAAMRQAEIEAVEALEAEARRRAFEGVTHERPIYYKGEQVGSELITTHSDLLMIFLLKAARPEKYRDRYDITSGGAPIAPLTVVVEAVPDRTLPDPLPRVPLPELVHAGDD